MDNPNQAQQKSNINLNMDNTPLYFTDFIIWNINKNEVVLNFGSKILGQNQIKVVARVGTSKEFFKQFLKDIEKKLMLSEVQGQTGKAKS